MWRLPKPKVAGSRPVYRSQVKPLLIVSRLHEPGIPSLCQYSGQKKPKLFQLFPTFANYAVQM